MSDEILNSGNFGTVKSYEINGRNYALKTINKDNFSLIELLVLSRIDNKYVIKSLLNQKYKITENEYSFQMEMKLVLDNFMSISYIHIKELITGCIYGMNCLHKKGFLHLDIKPSNIFYTIKNSVYVPVLGDFGLSAWVEDSKLGAKLKKRGTFRYMPYEIITEDKPLYLFTEKSDIWSLGITFFSCLFYPFLVSRKVDLYIEQINEILTTLKSNLFRDYFNRKQEIVIDEEIVNYYLTNSYETFETKFPNNTKLLVSDIKHYIDVNNLYNLLSSMLKRDPQDRISSDCLLKVSFIDKNLESSCLLADDEQYIIPYIDQNLFDTTLGIIIDYFKTNSDYEVKVLFMSIEILIKILTLITNDCITEKEYIFCERVDKSDYSNFAIQYALNYYDKLGGNTMVTYLNDINIIGYNKLFSESEYLEDLLYIYRNITINYNLFSLSNVINVKEMTDFFRNEYDYEGKDKNVTCKEFFNELSYIEDKNIKLPVSVENSEVYSIVNDSDYNFRKQMYDYVAPLIVNKFDKTGIDYISLLKRYIYSNDINKYLFDNLDKVINMVEVLNDVLYTNNRIAILLFDNNSLRKPNSEVVEVLNFNLLVNVITQEISLVTYYDRTYYQYYYKNDTFKNFCETNGYSYSLQSKSIISKSDLASILYSVYLNKNLTNNVILNDKTIIVILLYLFVDN